MLPSDLFVFSSEGKVLSCNANMWFQYDRRMDVKYAVTIVPHGTVAKWLRFMMLIDLVDFQAVVTLKHSGTWYEASCLIRYTNPCCVQMAWCEITHGISPNSYSFSFREKGWSLSKNSANTRFIKQSGKFVLSATRDAKLGNARSQLYLLSPPLFRNLLRCFRGTTNSMNEQRFFIFFIEFSLHEKTVEKKMTSRKRKTMASSSARKGPVIDFRGCNARACGENEICGQVKVCQTCTNNWIPLLESWTQVKNLDEQKGLRMLTDLENARLHKNFAGENPCIRLSRLAKEAQGGQTCGFDICGENDVCLPRMCHKCSEHVSSRLLGALFEQKYGKTWWEWISTKQLDRID